MARHRADLATNETQKKTALARAQHDYLTALDFASKSATGAGNVQSLAGIEKERALAVSVPDLPMGFPTDLPPALLPMRKAYMASIEHANADAKKREQ